MQGWIKLHRKLKQWEWYQQSEMVHLFIHLLLGANHQDNKWQGVDVKKGQLITGRKQLSMETGLSEQKIRTCLIKLKSTSDITIQPTNRFSLVTICNWDTYQCDVAEINQPVNQPTRTQSTNNQPAVNQQSTTNKNVKKEKNDKKTAYGDFVLMTKDEHQKLIEQFGEAGTKDRIHSLNLYIGSVGKKYKSHYLTILSWERKNKPAVNPKKPDPVCANCGGKWTNKKGNTHCCSNPECKRILFG